MKKKLLLFVLAFTLVFSMVPVMVGAEAEPTILWDFNSDGAMDDLMSGASNLVYLGDTDGTTEYYEFIANGADNYVTLNTPADDVSEIVWCKVRVKNLSPATAMELFGATNYRSLSGPECTHIDILPNAEEWYTYIIYIPDENVKTANTYKGASLNGVELEDTYWEGPVQSIRLDPMWQFTEDSDPAGGMEVGDTILIDYVAFFPTKADALSFRSDLDNYAIPEQGEGDDRVMEAAVKETVERAYGEPSILWNFDTTEEISSVMSGASAVEYTSGSDGTTEYYEFTAKDNDPLVTMTTGLVNVEDAAWAKARVKNVSGVATAIELYGSTNGRGLSGPECTHIDISTDTEEWQTVIINVAEANVATANQYKGATLETTYWEGVINSIRLDPMWRPAEDGTDVGGNMSDGDKIWIDYIAFFPTQEEAEAYEPAAAAAPVEEAPAETEAPVEEVPAETEAPAEVPAETEAPAAETVVETPAATAPQTFDFGVIAAIVSVISLGGIAISKKK